MWNALWFGIFSFLELLHLSSFPNSSYTLKHSSRISTLNSFKYCTEKPCLYLIFGVVGWNVLNWIMFVQFQLVSECFRHTQKAFTWPLIWLGFSGFLHSADFYTFLPFFSWEFPKLHFSRCKNSNSIQWHSLQTLFFKVQQLQEPLSNKFFSSHFRPEIFLLILPEIE